MLGRLIGSVATGGVVGLLAWLIAGSLAASVIAASSSSSSRWSATCIASGGGSAAAGRAVIFRGGSDWAAAVRATAAGFQRRRRQFRRRRRVGELVGSWIWASSASASICSSTTGGCGGSSRASAGADRAGDQGGRGHAFGPGALRGRGRARRQAAVPRSVRAGARARYLLALRIWDTAHNNGVLIYLLLADRKVEIVADRGIDAKVGARAGEKSARRWRANSRRANFAGGVIRGIEAVSRQLAAYFPRTGERTNCRIRRW